MRSAAVTLLAVVVVPHVFATPCTMRPAVSPWCLDSAAPATAIIQHAALSIVKLSRPSSVLSSAAPLVCTGWFVGSGGYVLTNHHCIATAAAAASTTFEFATSCVGTCRAPCRSSTSLRGSHLVATSADLDYTLVKLDHATWPQGLQLDGSDVSPLNQDVFVLQHQGGGPLVVAKDGVVLTTTYAGCVNSSRQDLLGYALDTADGSSGSPVVNLAVGSVVALHSCGGCGQQDGRLNAGIPIRSIIDDLLLQKALPRGALAATAPPPIEWTLVVHHHGELHLHSAASVSIDQYWFSLVDDASVSIHASTQDSSNSTAVALLAIDPTMHETTLLVTETSDLTYALWRGEYYIVVGAASSFEPLSSWTLPSRLPSSHGVRCNDITAAPYAKYELSLFADDAGVVDRWVMPQRHAVASTACAPEPRLRIQAIVSGTLYAMDSVVSTDLIAFEMARAGKLALDVVSFQETDNGTLAAQGLPGLCGRAYVDTEIYIFESTWGTVVATSSNRSTTKAKTTDVSSISTRDPYVEVYLPRGNYTVVVGQEPLALDQAIHVIDPGPRDIPATPLLCGKPSTRGHYHVFFRADQPLVARPPGSFDQTACVTEVC
ncbi:unnamed protein product [Aphanomyces euteiches]